MEDVRKLQSSGRVEKGSKIMDKIFLLWVCKILNVQIYFENICKIVRYIKPDEWCNIQSLSCEFSPLKKLPPILLPNLSQLSRVWIPMAMFLEGDTCVVPLLYRKCQNPSQTCKKVQVFMDISNAKDII